MKPELDYSNLPPHIMAIIDEFREDVIEDVTIEDATVSYDGKQFLVRIPGDIARAIKMKKGDKFRFIVKNTLSESVLSIEYIRSDNHE